MTLTATRDSALTAVGLKPKAKTPEALLSDALGDFSKLETKLEHAVDEVVRQETALQNERQEIEQKLAKAEGARNHLQRIQARVKDFLS